MNFKFNLLLLALCIIGDRSTATVFNSCFESGTTLLNIVCSTAGQLTFPSRTAANTQVTTPIELVVISKQAFTSIPDGSFFGLSVNNAVISGNGLTSVTAGAFTGATKMGILSFSESTLNTIATTAFDPIKSTLTELSFISSLITVTRFNTLKDGIQTLNTLTKLTLDTNSLISLNAGWLNGLTGLTTFSAKTNQIVNVDADTFKFNTALKTVDLTSNQLADMAALNTALTPLAATLETLNLGSNKFTSIVDFPALAKLKVLDLKSNLIATIASTNSFVNMPALTTIDLSTNSLTAIPAIVNQLGLLSYDLSTNQITTIAANSLSRSTVPTTGALVNLNGQTITSFPSAAFCSASDPFYSQIDIGSASMANFNKCLFKQLKPANAGLRVKLNVVAATGVTDFTSICNCANKVFANANQVDLIGACLTFVDACTTTTYVDDCPTTYTCARASTSGSNVVRVDYLGFILLNAAFLVAYKQI